MADKSKIEWCDASWNPCRARNLKTGKVGWHCEHATTGCEFCYSEGFNKRLGTGLPYKPGHRKDIEIFLDEEMLIQPLRWKKPRRIFVGSMTDIFADFVTDEMLDKMLAVMALAPQHTFQMLTKRAKRMRSYFERYRGGDDHNCADMVADAAAVLLGKPGARGADRYNGRSPGWPLPNVWLGVSAERQQEADERIPALLATPAAIRFLSLEPLLGPIDLKRWVPTGKWGTFKGQPVYNSKYFLTKCERCGWLGSSELCDVVSYGDDADAACPSCKEIFMCDEVQTRIDLAIVGGESGSKARPMHPDWARSLRDQCHAANTAFFFKQWGAFAPVEISIDEFCQPDDAHVGEKAVWENGRLDVLPPFGRERFQIMRRMSKAAAGRLLDGVEHNAFPKVPA